MRHIIVLAAILAVGVSGCSTTAASNATNGFAIVPSPSSALVIDAKKPLITPTYLYIESEGSYGNFEVDGRKAKNAGRWTSKTNCKNKVDIVFNGYNAQGSSYTAFGYYPGTCTYTVTNPNKRRATLTIQISSDRSSS
jgi:hypothetical protein